MQTKFPRLYRYQPQKLDTNTMLEWVKDLVEGTEIDLMNTLRWEDDGGRLVAAENLQAASSDPHRSS